MYLASSQTNTEQHLTVIFCGSDRLLQILLQFVFGFTDADQFYGALIGSFTDMEYSLIFYVF